MLELIQQIFSLPDMFVSQLTFIPEFIQNALIDTIKFVPIHTLKLYLQS